MKALLTIIVATFLFVACSSDKSGEAISYAEIQIANNDFAGAQKTCDNLMAGKASKSFLASDLCRMAIIYMKLSERYNESENIAVATQCYRTANTINADSVTDFFANTPIEEAQYEATLKSLAKSLDNPQEIIGEEPTDSIHLIQDSLYHE